MIFSAESHPSRGAWIEIAGNHTVDQVFGSRTPRGVRGLKFVGQAGILADRGRTPRGVRGLKLVDPYMYILLTKVAPLAGCVD